MRSRSIGRLQTKQGVAIEVDLFYEIGGMNVVTGKERDRGYYLSVAPVGLEGEYRRFSGVVTKVQDARKFSKRIFNLIVPPPEVVDRLIRKVIEKNKLTVKQWKY